MKYIFYESFCLADPYLYAEKSIILSEALASAKRRGEVNGYDARAVILTEKEPHFPKGYVYYFDIYGLPYEL